MAELCRKAAAAIALLITWLSFMVTVPFECARLCKGADKDALIPRIGLTPLYRWIHQVLELEASYSSFARGKIGIHPG